MLLRVYLVLVVMMATAAADSKPAATREVSEADTKAWVGLFDKIVDAVVAHRTDCPTMATDLDAIINVNQAAIKIARDAKASGKVLPASAQQHMLDGSRRMIQSLDKCGRDQKVGAAFARLDLGGHQR
jgi:hypothetical protein